MQSTGPCLSGDATLFMQMVLAALSVVSTCFAGWLATRQQEAKHEREYNFRTLQLEMHRGKVETIQAVNDGTCVVRSGENEKQPAS